MIIAVIRGKWNEFCRNDLKGWMKRRDDQLSKIDRAHERSISILQKRYGYTREEAASQLKKHYSKAWLKESDAGSTRAAKSLKLILPY